jgi:hypothetical protein
MIKIYKSTENGLIQLDDFIPNCWINVVDRISSTKMLP